MKPKDPRPDSATTDREASWAQHSREWRSPHQIATQWRTADEIDPALLEHRVRGPWWDLLDELGMTLIVTREYEHLVMAFSVQAGRRQISWLHLPHPNGLAVDPRQGHLFIASTRNPNVVFEFAPCAGDAGGGEAEPEQRGRLLPVAATFCPGCLYIHDLALIQGVLHANAVGLNAVARLEPGGGFRPVWWPRCIDTPSRPRFDRNYLQVNSIAAGPSLQRSFFSASTAAPGRYRPGHPKFPVDRRGVIFSGATREVVATGLTRPHSARLRGRQLWVDNSGYGEVGPIVDGRLEPLTRLPGWTRGLYFHGNRAVVATSRVIPRFRQYAPGLEPDRCETGVHVLDLDSGHALASMVWPNGNQIFAIEGIGRHLTAGFPFTPRRAGSAKATIHLFARGRVA
jgi:uncharacterized protein (TIGR03032 family)